MLMIGKDFYIRDLKREDVEQMTHWGTHRDPLFRTYNFPEGGASQRDYWFNKKSNSYGRRIFGVFLESGKLIGYITIKGSSQLFKSAHLGIVFDPDYIAMGHGTKGLQLFLEYYFHRWRMKKLYLKVAAFNERARKVYEKLGFLYKKEKMEPFENEHLRPEELRKRGYKPHHFSIRRDQIFCLYQTMLLTKDIHNTHSIHKKATSSVDK